MCFRPFRRQSSQSVTSAASSIRSPLATAPPAVLPAQRTPRPSKLPRLAQSPSSSSSPWVADVPPSLPPLLVDTTTSTPPNSTGLAERTISVSSPNFPWPASAGSPRPTARTPLPLVAVVIDVAEQEKLLAELKTGPFAAATTATTATTTTPTTSAATTSTDMATATLSTSDQLETGAEPSPPDSNKDDAMLSPAAEDTSPQSQATTHSQFINPFYTSPSISATPVAGSPLQAEWEATPTPKSPTMAITISTDIEITESPLGPSTQADQLDSTVNTTVSPPSPTRKRKTPMMPELLVKTTLFHTSREKFKRAALMGDFDLRSTYGVSGDNEPDTNPASNSDDNELGYLKECDDVRIDPSINLAYSDYFEDLPVTEIHAQYAAAPQDLFLRKLRGLVLGINFYLPDALAILHNASGDWEQARWVISKGPAAGGPTYSVWSPDEDHVLLAGTDEATIQALMRRKGSVAIRKRLRYLQSYYQLELGPSESTGVPMVDHIPPTESSSPNESALVPPTTFSTPLLLRSLSWSHPAPASDHIPPSAKTIASLTRAHSADLAAFNSTSSTQRVAIISPPASLLLPSPPPSVAPPPPPPSSKPVPTRSDAQYLSPGVAEAVVQLEFDPFVLAAQRFLPKRP
ncbi:hypothetical protein H4R33_005765 [Dimargaris cristalligena]|nr:hypothetical protein H4R33_005765 [Dimargaris cristalligena]